MTTGVVFALMPICGRCLEVWPVIDSPTVADITDVLPTNSLRALTITEGSSKRVKPIRGWLNRHPQTPSASAPVTASARIQSHRFNDCRRRERCDAANNDATPDMLHGRHHEEIGC